MFYNQWFHRQYIKFKHSSDCTIQNVFHNGCSRRHYFTNIIVFASNDIIFVCAIDVLGALNDSTVAEIEGVYDKLDRVYNEFGEKVAADFAFCRASNPFLIK